MKRKYEIKTLSRNLKRIKNIPDKDKYVRNWKWLQSKGLTISDFARSVEGNYGTVTHWMRGKDARPVWKRAVLTQWPSCPFWNE